MNSSTVGILGAGKVGIVLAQLLLKAGYNVHIAGSGTPEKITLSVNVLAPGAHAMSAEDVCSNSDIIILALPLHKFKSVPKHALSGKLVIDSMNYWWEVDGPRESIVPDDVSSSEAVRDFLLSARVIKALSHTGYHELHDTTAPKGAAHRKAIAVAGDDQEDITSVSKIIDDIGFDPLPIGPLSNGIYLEPGYSAFGANVNSSELNALIRRDIISQHIRN